MKKLVIASLISSLLFSTIAETADWVIISTTVDGVEFYIDKESTRIKSNTINGWIKQLTPQGDSRIIYQQTDCVNMRWRGLEYIHYSSSGTVIDSSQYSSPWQSVIPDSASDGIWKRMCALWIYGKQTGKSTSRFRVE